MTSPHLIEAIDVVRIYESRRGPLSRPLKVRAVDGVSLAIDAGETLGIVGESGCGKSTLGRALIGIDAADGGAVRLAGAPMPRPGTALWRASRRDVQLVYQDPLAALDRRLTIAAQIGEPLDIHAIGDPTDRLARVRELMTDVGLDRDLAGRYPHELSGGQRQRVVIARALAARPKLIVCDEPVSALDVSIQAQIVNLLRDIQASHHLAMVFISHDLKVVRNIADRVAVMYLGRVVEEAPSDVIFADPRHPYTAALVSSVPEPGRPRQSRQRLQGEPPNPARRPSGCAFHPRCPLARDLCRDTAPPLADLEAGRTIACHVVAGATLHAA
jgi:peptide/nickel transport system ATP-binding protein